MWEGWFEFIPITPEGKIVVSAVESRQPALEHLEYWAQGLSVIYAEGALDRALHPITIRTRMAETPVSSRPARRTVVVPTRDRRGVGALGLDAETGSVRFEHEPGFSAPTTSLPLVMR